MIIKKPQQQTLTPLSNSHFQFSILQLMHILAFLAVCLCMCACMCVSVHVWRYSQALRHSGRTGWPTCGRVQLSWTVSWTENKGNKTCVINPQMRKPQIKSGGQRIKRIYVSPKSRKNQFVVVWSSTNFESCRNGRHFASCNKYRMSHTNLFIFFTIKFEKPPKYV